MLSTAVNLGPSNFASVLWVFPRGENTEIHTPEAEHSLESNPNCCLLLIEVNHLVLELETVMKVVQEGNNFPRTTIMRRILKGRFGFLSVLHSRIMILP